MKYKRVKGNKIGAPSNKQIGCAYRWESMRNCHASGSELVTRGSQQMHLGAAVAISIRGPLGSPYVTFEMRDAVELIATFAIPNSDENVE